MPPLKGEYEIALDLKGENIPKGQVVQAFERKSFPWENTALGRSTKVFPPFTPIVMDGNKLQTVLRDYTLNDLGLLDQVVATSANTKIAKPILAAPMRYAEKVGGADAPVQPEKLRVVLAKPNEVVTAASFKAGGLGAAWTNTWDYDGTVRVDLTLKPTGGKVVDELTLEIPLRADAATHIHANSDRIRAPIMERIPARDGPAWDARRLACDDFIRSFCPYVYVGNPVRGLCWFAENDKGWSWNPDTPNAEVVRRGDRVLLRIHLINQPVAIAAPRTLSFGMLAAPAKPPLVAPGQGPNWWRYRYYRDRYNLLGTDINWLAIGNCGSVYPAGKDMYLWKMLALGNRERINDADYQSVVERGRKYFEPYGEDYVDRFVAHCGNLRSRYGLKMIFYYNRVSCEVFDEFETFKDEWTLDDLRSVGKGNGVGEIKVVPSPSYIDYNLYWHAKSFEIGGNQGGNWDNFFIAPSFNTEMTDAYRRPDGSIAPAAGIWGLRDLARRTFIMMNERGMLPITFPHMTSFSPLPMLSFATMQYDWEWKSSEGDVHSRHTREFVTVVTAGELAGVWPVPLHDHGALAEDPWMQRTFTAVRLVHELDGVGGFGYSDTPVYKKNAEAAKPDLHMLDRPGLQVYKYWEDRPQPVKATNPDLPTIVYSVPGQEAVVAVVSHARQDETANVVVDAKALGFQEGCAAVNCETGETVPIAGGRMTFPLERHDLRVLRLTAAK